MKIIPRKHQPIFAKKIWDILKVYGYVYLAGKPRSEKTYTSILCAEMSTKIKSVIVLTTKNAIPGWNKFIVGNKDLNHKYIVVNYEQVASYKTITHTVTGRKLKKPKTTIQLKLNPKVFDLAIIDESHNLGKLGKPSLRFEAIKALCWEMPHIHLSGTAIVESPCRIYYQMAISKYSPFKHNNFYSFFKDFGEPYYKKINGRDVNQYDRPKDILMPYIDQFTVYMTQEDAGIDKTMQAIDKPHYITLNADTQALYNEILQHKIAKVQGQRLVCDSVMKERTSLHMIEGGVVKIDDDYIMLGNTEKIDYIKKEWGDASDIGIMCHFIGERMLLKEHFKEAEIYSSTSHAEGVDLSHLRYFIIYSGGYSGAKFIQRRDRIINTNGSNTLEVQHLLVKKAISEQVYKKTSKKEDFNNKTYERQKI